MTVADPAIIAGLVFAWGTLSARLERFDMTAPIVFTAAGVQTWPSRAARPATNVIAFTVLLSVLAHGLSAGPLAKRYGPRLTPPPGTAGPTWLAEISERRLIRRAPAASQPAARGRH